ncbi:Ig-like domain-containing protein [Pontibacter sp. 172403-2]|uniref:Ig-like domain-containing domain n=1 Tax=Pontibacter rufus TaxID=2791028 RepID=UPI0018AFB168|nr:Ig-like domain-containing domain [Pontibacter sp. 172403-2]MBF9253097.1 Ig-like domain-containing protein [Pontibacter sp. 172403-2]
MKIYSLLLTAAAALGICSCASISSPDGGPKDLAAPILVSSSPKSQQLNVTGKTISLTFNELIQAKNLTRELLITPNTGNKYEVKTDKETITLEFEEPLQENTTYTLNFREGLTDITESNVAQGLKLAFSTGTFIDSSKVAGTVVELLTQEPEIGAIVALYPAADTLNIREDLPYYQAQADSSGSFFFENIKEGDYRMYALIDKNKNSKYDNENEKIGYLSTTVHVSPTTEPVKLQTVRIDTKKPILLRRENYTDRFIANYNEGIQTFSARPLEQPTDSIYFKPGIDGKAFQLFKTQTFAGGKAILSAVDTAGNMAIDTLQIEFTGKRAQLIKGAQLKVTNKSDGDYSAGQTVTIELETPVNITGTEPISIMADSVLLQKLKYPEEITLDPSKTELRFQLPAIKSNNRQLSLLLDSTAIVPLQGEALKFKALPIAISETSGTGSIKGMVNTEETSFIVQLLNMDYVPIAEIANKKKFAFPKLEPGQYRIRVLVDENKNGSWDKPDPELKKPMEQVYFYPQPIDVRANWDVEDIKLEF